MPLTLQYGKDEQDNRVVNEVVDRYNIDLVKKPNDGNYHPQLSGEWGEHSGALAVGRDEVVRSLILQHA